MTEPVRRYVDLAGGWPGSVAAGVAVEPDGLLRLAPLAGDPVALAAPSAGAIEGSASIGVAPDGTVYVARPGENAVTVVECDGSVHAFACLGGPGGAVGRLESPSAVLVGPRHALYVADTGNRRIQVVDLATGSVTGVWPGFVEPVDLAVDADDRIYVADRGGPSLARFDADGREDTTFRVTVSATSDGPRAPSAITVVVLEGEERLLVVDRPAGAPPVLAAYRLDGTLDRDLSTALARIVVDDVASAQATGGVLYLAGAGGVLAFGFDGSFLGRLSQAHGSASGLALDCRGRLVVAAGGAVARLEPTRRVERGRLLVGPIPLAGGIPRWDRVVAELGAPLPPGARLRIWTLVGGSATPAFPPDAVVGGEDPARTPPGRWRAAPRDAHDTLVLHEPAPFLWICLELASDGVATPAVAALRVDWLGLGLLEKLPALYARDDGDETAWRLLALLAAPLDELAAGIADLSLLFDAAAVPDRSDAAWLDVLAAWLAMPLERSWQEPVRRGLVAEAFVRHGLRGTRAALEETLGRAADTTVTVTEPIAGASLWQLDGEGSVLGFTTMLAAAEAQGAAVGTTAVVDRSHLIRDEDLGRPLFVDVAHRFCVHVQGAAVDDVRLGVLRAAIETEKPAHTLAHLCVLEPRTTVGFQARVGVDMFVASGPPQLTLGDELDARHALKAADRTTSGDRVGDTIRVGRAPTPALPGGHR